MYADLDTPCSLVLIERWQWRAHYQAYNDWRQQQGDLTRLAAMLEQPPKRRYFEHVAV